MKKIMLAGFITCFIAQGLYAGFNVDLETGLTYMNYLKNDAFFEAQAMAAAQGVSLNAIDMYQEFRTKYGAENGNVKFTFDARFYLRPDAQYFDYIIDSAYMQVENGGFVLYAGKQRLKWGTGYMWNPSDLLQAGKDLLNPTLRLEGVIAVRAEYSNDFVTPSVIFIPEPKEYSEDFNSNFTYAVQLYRNVLTADIFVNAIYKFNRFQSVGAAVSGDLDWFVLNAEGAAIRYMDASLSALRAAGRAGPDDIRYSFILGFQRTIGDFFMNLELYSNGWGMANDDGSYADETVFGTHRAYVSGIISYTWEQMLGIGFTALWGVDGGAGFLYPTLSWVQSQDWNVSLSWLQNVSGGFNKEWLDGIPVHNMLQVKLNGYF